MSDKIVMAVRNIRRKIEKDLGDDPAQFRDYYRKFQASLDAKKIRKLPRSLRTKTA